MLDSWTSVVAAAATTSAAAVVAGLVYQKRLGIWESAVEPKRWIRVGTVAELVIYPIKGCAGIHVKQAKATELGLKEGEFMRDRVFMVVNDKGIMQSLIQFPQLSLVSVSTNDDGQITLRTPEIPSITFQIPDKNSTQTKICKIFQENGLQAVDCGDEASEWLEKVLKQPGLRLVYHHLSKTQRHISGLQKQFSTVSKKDLAVFQNYTAFLLISQESIDELNKHLENKVTARNFRPSILVSDVPEAFSEIRWGIVRIWKHVLLRASKPCERCKITTVDENGKHSADGEPLKTLSKLQMEFGDEVAKKVLKNRGIMGLQMGLLHAPKNEEDSIIKVGDPIYVALL